MSASRPVPGALRGSYRPPRPPQVQEAWWRPDRPQAPACASCRRAARRRSSSRRSSCWPFLKAHAWRQRRRQRADCKRMRRIGPPPSLSRRSSLEIRLHAPVPDRSPRRRTMEDDPFGRLRIVRGGWSSVKSIGSSNRRAARSGVFTSARKSLDTTEHHPEARFRIGRGHGEQPNLQPERLVTRHPSRCRPGCRARRGRR